MILQGVLNRLLAHSPDAMLVLSSFSGRNVRIETPLKSATLVVTESGYFGNSIADPEVSLNLSLSFFIVRTHDSRAAAKQVEMQGDRELGEGVAHALSLLRWDVAEELSLLVGDVLANRLVTLARVLAGIPSSLGGRLLASCAEYLRDEKALLPNSAQVECWRSGIDCLNKDTEALEQRIARLE